MGVSLISSGEPATLILRSNTFLPGAGTGRRGFFSMNFRKAGQSSGVTR